VNIVPSPWSTRILAARVTLFGLGLFGQFTIRPTQACWRRGAGVDPHHEEDHKIAGRGLEPELRDRSRKRETAGTGDCPGGSGQSKQSQGKLERAYGKLLNSTSRVVGQAKRFSKEITDRVEAVCRHLEADRAEGLRQELDAIVAAGAAGDASNQSRASSVAIRGAEGKLLSLFEPSTEIIRKGKAGKPNEFGKMVKLQEAEKPDRDRL